MQIKKFGLLTLSALLLSGCGSIDGPGVEFLKRMGTVKDAVPKDEPYSRIGNDPYRVAGKTYVPLKSARGFKQEGIASWYGKKFHGRFTSNGEKYDMYAMTAAHKTLPLPTYVSVKNKKNGRKIIVRVNDRGPFVGDRIIDLSYSAAKKLDLVKSGTGPVVIQAISKDRQLTATLPDRTYYLQTGSFGNKNNARIMRETLRSAGIAGVVIKEKRVSGSRFYQVRVGPIESTGRLDQMIERLGALISETPMIVSE